jgi:hypothetical protein
VAQNEYRVWKTSDPHARAFEVLQSEAATEIARRLGAGAATEDQSCLSCHTGRRPGVEEGPRFTLGEGVGCESCHGPASNWIGPHARGLYHYDEILKAGLYPTADAAERARQCLRCHGPGRVRHELIAAGHPALLFDLAAYSRLQPAHFVVDSDYRQRKRPLSEAATWGIGASLTLAARLRSMADAVGANAAFPDFASFACESCHRPISDRWRPAGAIGSIVDIGEVPALSALATRLDPALAGELNARAAATRLAIGDRPTLARSALALAESAERLAQALARADVSGADAEAALRALANSAERPSPGPGGRATAFALRAFSRTAPRVEDSAVARALAYAPVWAPPARLAEDDARLRAGLARAPVDGEPSR